MADFKKQIKKGLLELAILDLLKEKDYYGYMIIQEINHISNNILDLKEGTLYPILYRLEDSELINSYWETSDDSRAKPRKYYQITDLGKQRLNKMKNEYNEISNGINKILSRNLEA